MVFETEAQRAEIVARAWEDPEFKARLLADPKAALAEMGIDVPEEFDLQVVESTPQKGIFVLPPQPSSELSEEELDMVAGGMTSCCRSCHSCEIAAPGKDADRSTFKPKTLGSTETNWSWGASQSGKRK